MMGGGLKGLGPVDRAQAGTEEILDIVVYFVKCFAERFAILMRFSQTTHSIREDIFLAQLVLAKPILILRAPYYCPKAHKIPLKNLI